MSPGTRLPAADVKATKRPSPDTAGSELGPSASAKLAPRLTRLIVPFWLTNTSGTPLWSSGTRLVASEVKATTAPLSDTAGWPAPAGPLASACPPPLFTLTRVVRPAESATAPAGRGPTGPSSARSTAVSAGNTQRRNRRAIRPPSVLVSPTLSSGVLWYQSMVGNPADLTVVELLPLLAGRSLSARELVDAC